MDLVTIRNECKNASRVAHARMAREWDIYHNIDYHEDERVLRDMVPRAQKSLNPQIQKGIMRLISPFMEQASRMEVQPDRSDHQQDDLIFTEDLQNWNEMHEEADNETETLKSLVLHNLVGGMSVAKTYYDPRTKIVRSETVNPTSISVDGEASRVDLSDAMAVVQECWHDEYYLRRHYDWEPRREPRWDIMGRKHRYKLPTHRLDEIWLRRELAEDCEDFDQDALKRSDKQIFRAVLIDDEVVRLTGTPYWWPEFPFSFWRNFTSSFDKRKGQDFWGFGYGTLLSPQQKFLDEMLAALVAIARNMPSGQVITTKGALDPEQQYNLDGQIIELQAGKDIGVDFQKLEPDAMPPVFGEMVQYITQVMQEQMPSLSEVFTGESPSSGSSGRAINSLQWAAFTQLSENLKAMNEFRRRRVIQRLTGIQQTARAPLAPHVWRGGLDLPAHFPEDARYVGFNVVANDASAMPHSPAAKLQILQTFASLGYMMELEEALKFTGFDRGYGLTPEMFQNMLQMVPPGMGAPGGQPGQTGMPANVMAGAEAPLP